MPAVTIGFAAQALPSALRSLRELVFWRYHGVYVDKKNAEAYTILLQFIASIPDFRENCRRWMKEQAPFTAHEGEEAVDPLERAGLVLGPQTVKFQWRGCTFRVRKLLPSSEGAPIQPAEGSEIIEVLVARSDKELLLALLEEAERTYNEKMDGRCIKVLKPNEYGQWQVMKTIPLEDVRRIAPVYEGEAARVLTLCREHFEQGGSGGRLRGVLLKGRPGSGKSQWVLLAALLSKANVCWLDLSSQRVSNDVLEDLVSRAPKRSILVLEDIDDSPCCRARSRLDDGVGGEEADSVVWPPMTNVAAQAAAGGSDLRLKSVLNTMDGLLKGRGDLVWFLTTNAASVLDPALVRPGRVSHKLEFGYASGAAAYRLFRFVFYREANDAAARDVKREYERLGAQMTVAELHHLFNTAGHMNGAAHERMAMIHDGMERAHQARMAQELAEEAAPENPVTAWLRRHSAAQYAQVFEAHRIQPAVVPELTHELLTEMGVHEVGVRMALMRARNEPLVEPLL